MAPAFELFLLRKAACCKCSTFLKRLAGVKGRSNIVTAPQRPDSQAAAVGVSKKPRMVFTEIQRRTLVAIFKEIKRPSKEIQATIAEQLGLKVSTVGNFFMNARRRSIDKYTEDASLEQEAAHNTVTSSENSLDEQTPVVRHWTCRCQVAVSISDWIICWYELYYK